MSRPQFTNRRKEELLLKLCTLAMASQVFPYLPFGLYDEVKDYLSASALPPDGQTLSADIPAAPLDDDLDPEEARRLRALAYYDQPGDQWP